MRNDNTYGIISELITEDLLVYDCTQKEFVCFPAWNIERIYSECPECFWLEYIHPDDQRWVKKLFAIMKEKRFTEMEFWESIDYITGIVRLQAKLFSVSVQTYLPQYFKLIFNWERDQLRHIYCSLSPSVIRKQDCRLYIYHKNQDCEVFLTELGKWISYPFKSLSPRETEMLTWAKHGLSIKETAEKMQVTQKTIENMRYTLFERLGVNTIEQAIRFTSNRKMQRIH